jgi:hypothetical protein
VSQTKELIERLGSCPTGFDGWHEFENVCIDILSHLFVPPLIGPRIQPRTYSGVSRRDAVFPIREQSIEQSYSWKQLSKDLNARLLLFEFKNYDSTEIGPEEVNQTLCYMTNPMGLLSILVCSKKPNDQAHKRRNTIYSDNKKVILFLEKKHLKEMLYIKERGDDPADLIVDELETFFLQHE